MGIIAQDNGLTGGRGSPNAWSPGSNGSNYTQRRSDQTLSFPSSGNLVATFNTSTLLGIITYSSQTPADQEILTSFIAGSTLTVIGAIGRWSNNSSYYYCDLFNVPGSLEIGKNNGSFNSLATASFSASAGVQYYMRFRCKGAFLYGKVWDASTIEPNGWMINAFNDTSFSSGNFGICTDAVAGHPDTFNSLLVNDTNNTTIFYDGYGTIG